MVGDVVAKLFIVIVHKVEYQNKVLQALFILLDHRKNIFEELWGLNNIGLH